MDMIFGMDLMIINISMTQLAAKFCQWLSAMTGKFYRLPTRSRVEYAWGWNRYILFFGEDIDKLKDFAWFKENSNESYQKVGKKSNLGHS